MKSQIDLRRSIILKHRNSNRIKNVYLVKLQDALVLIAKIQS